MAFCAYCGKPLEEGQVCGCPESVAAAQPVQPQNHVNPQPDQSTYSQAYQQNQGASQMSEEASQAVAAMSQAASKTGNVLTEAFGYLLLILKEPVAAGNRFIVSANIKVACILILFQGIMSGLLSLIIAGKINSLIAKVGAVASAGLTAVIGGGSGITINDVISPGKAFFLTLLMSIVFSLIYALLTWAVAAISKGKTTYQQMIAAAGVRSAVAVAVIGASIILFIINPFTGICVFFVVGVFFSIVVFVESLNAVEGINKNIKTYFAPIAMTVFCILLAYLTIRTAPQAISDYYLKMIKAIGDIDWSDLENILGYLDL